VADGLDDREAVEHVPRPERPDAHQRQGKRQPGRMGS
jgi:hypothetical protein